jgi:hypothetical protein
MEEERKEPGRWRAFAALFDILDDDASTTGKANAA